LQAGKHVFVEKPLCLTEEELSFIEEVYDGSLLLMVGFNRRFAPLALEIKKILARRTTPLVITYRVNAGYIPEDSWVHDPEMGGGRLLGEGCHFIDFLQFMVEAKPTSVSCLSISGNTGKYRPDDNLVLTLTFADGSVGSITYTAKGSKSFSRERVEVYGDESVGVIEDFRRGQIIRGSTSRTIKKMSMDMGYAAELEFFLGPKPNHPEYYWRLFEGYVTSTRATLKAAESLRTGKIVPI
jgi:predicted dehydrogenase